MNEALLETQKESERKNERAVFVAMFAPEELTSASHSKLPSHLYVPW